MTRDERIESAITDCKLDPQTAAAFRATAAALPEMWVFWNPDAGNQFAILESKTTSIEFHSLT